MVNDTPSDELVKRLRGKYPPSPTDALDAAARIRELEAYALKQLDDINRLTTELVKAKAANRRKP